MILVIRLLKKILIIINNIFSALIFLIKITFLKLTNSNYIVLRYYRNKKSNFGDDLNIYLLKKFQPSLKVVKYAINPLFKNRLYFIGSIIKYDLTNSIILGSGIIQKNQFIKNHPKLVLSVRGPLTRKQLLDNNISCPEKYGDPALIMPLVYNPKISKKFKYGIVPHFKDKFLPIFANFDYENTTMIDIQSDIESFITRVLECEIILSSSLHGLIIADAYNIKSKWIKISENVNGEGFKFQDYYASLGIYNETPIIANNMEEIFEIIQSTEFRNNIEFNFVEYKEFIEINLEKHKKFLR